MCKYKIRDCLFRGTPVCNKCTDISEYKWDYTLDDTYDDYDSSPMNTFSRDDYGE